jgi:hypothetical protein
MWMARRDAERRNLLNDFDLSAGNSPVSPAATAEMALTCLGSGRATSGTGK